MKVTSVPFPRPVIVEFTGDEAAAIVRWFEDFELDRRRNHSFPEDVVVSRMVHALRFGEGEE